MTQPDADARSPERLREITHDILRETGVAEDHLASAVTLEDLGLDSSDAVQIELDVQRRAGVQVDLREHFPTLTVNAVVSRVVQAAEN